MRKRQTKRTPFSEYLFLKSKGLITSPTDEELAQLERPLKLCGRYTPSTLNILTMGELADLIEQPDNPVAIITTITGCSEAELMQEPYERVVGFINFVTSESHRIAELFNQLEINHTPEELQAGVKDLNFGIFGTIDWYARRMGITDHDEVMKVRWIRIWQCAMNDSQQADYEKRYRDIINRGGNK